MALYKDVFSGDTMFDSTRFQFDVVDDVSTRPTAHAAR